MFGSTFSFSFPLARSFFVLSRPVGRSGSRFRCFLTFRDRHLVGNRPIFWFVFYNHPRANVRKVGITILVLILFQRHFEHIVVVPPATTVTCI
ncbi:hypothetical protein HanRHA438_Chr06g0251251 [Helianthus annuus]|nr:hypothetical protein HanRHA438_Chr06g0251251 [Helianthus annuus]